MKALILSFALAAAPAIAQDHARGDAQPYAGFESREIAGLSQDDIGELRRGGGWGLALPAELNGKPGPAHLLELKEELALSDAQVEAIEAIFAEMKAEAIATGERLIAAERALSDAFADDDLTEARLVARLAESEAARADLRRIHLARHLETPPLLSARQIERYNVLRGYADDPCLSVPEGHDAEMWRKHNGCS